MRAQLCLSCRSCGRATLPLVTTVAALLSGCWALPSASVHPAGGPRVIQGVIEAEWVADSATIKGSLTVFVPPLPGRSSDARVLAVDPSYRVLTVRYPSGRTQTFKLRLHSPTGGIQAGDSVAIRPMEVIKLRAR